MEYRQLGRTGTRVSTLCLGAMNFNDANADEGVATIDAALDAGINFIDTANVYSRGQSEAVVGRALEGKRDGVVVATKVHGRMTDEGQNDYGNSRRHIKLQCEASLKRLRTDYIDLYQLHRPDPSTPVEESLQALDDLVREGKVHYVGFSTFLPAWQTMEALAIAERHHLASAPVCEQPPYNLLERRIEGDLVPLAKKHGLALIPWSPLAWGILTGKYSGGVPEGSRLSRGDRTSSEEFKSAVAKADALSKLAAGAGLSLIALSLAWLNHMEAVTSPIIGPKDRAQLADNLAAADVKLDDDLLARIDEIVPPQSVTFPLY